MIRISGFGGALTIEAPEAAMATAEHLTVAVLGADGEEVAHASLVARKAVAEWLMAKRAPRGLEVERASAEPASAAAPSPTAGPLKVLGLDESLGGRKLRPGYRPGHG